jgi:hypothetical protein
MGRVYKLVVLKHALFTLVCGTFLSIIGRLVRVLRGLGVPALFGRVAFSIRVSLLSSKIHNGDDTPKESLPSSSDVNNEWRYVYTSTSFVRLHSVDRDKFYVQTVIDIF